MSKPVLLQSGFVSKGDKYLVLPKRYDHNYVDNILVKNFKHAEDNNFYSRNITELYTQYRSDNAISRNFIFRKRVFKEVKRLFKEESFDKWLKYQIKHASITQLHKLFLYDTISTITNGIYDPYIREVQPEQYISLIRYNNEAKSVSFDMDNYIKKTQRSDIRYLPEKVTDIMQLWLSSPKGFGDMLVTMYVIFGDRPYIENVRHNPI